MTHAAATDHVAQANSWIVGRPQSSPPISVCGGIASHLLRPQPDDEFSAEEVAEYYSRITLNGILT